MLLFVCMVPTISRTVHMLAHLMFSTTYEIGCFYNPHFAEEKTKVQRGEITCVLQLGE